MTQPEPMDQDLRQRKDERRLVLLARQLYVFIGMLGVGEEPSLDLPAWTDLPVEVQASIVGVVANLAPSLVNVANQIYKATLPAPTETDNAP